MTEILEPDHHELEEGCPSPLFQAAMPEGAMYCSTSFQPLMRRPLLQRFRPGFMRQVGCGGGHCFFPGHQGDQHRLDRFRQFMPGNQNQMWSQIINLLNNIVRRLEQMNGGGTPNPNLGNGEVSPPRQVEGGLTRHFYANGFVDRNNQRFAMNAVIDGRMYRMVPGRMDEWNVAEPGVANRTQRGRIQVVNGRLQFVPNAPLAV